MERQVKRDSMPPGLLHTSSWPRGQESLRGDGELQRREAGHGQMRAASHLHVDNATHLEDSRLQPH